VEQIINDVLMSVIFNLKMKHISCEKKKEVISCKSEGALC
jgi:hypothetical protein